MADDVRTPRTPETHDPYVAALERYDDLQYRRVGNSGLLLPPLSLGLWWNFGDNRTFDTQREILRHAFDHGITHFDLANNYGPPAGSAEENFGRMMRTDFRPYRNEMIISSKAGYDMWPGPYGNWASAKYLRASADESLQRMGLDYVDIFYSHRPDPQTPIEETVGALDQLVRQGKALYVGISSYSPERTAAAKAVARELGTPLVIHQPSYSMLNRWIEEGKPSLLEAAAEEGMGVIGFSAMAQGILTDKYLNGVPEGSRLASGKVNEDFFTEETLDHVRALNDIAEGRGQTLAQMAVAWVLRDQGKVSLTTALIGASSVEQLEDTVKSVKNLDFTDEELSAIDEHAVNSGINQWWGATASR